MRSAAMVPAPFQTVRAPQTPLYLLGKRKPRSLMGMSDDSIDWGGGGGGDYYDYSGDYGDYGGGYDDSGSYDTSSGDSGFDFGSLMDWLGIGTGDVQTVDASYDPNSIAYVNQDGSETPVYFDPSTGSMFLPDGTVIDAGTVSPTNAPAGDSGAVAIPYTNADGSQSAVWYNPVSGEMYLPNGQVINAGTPDATNTPAGNFLPGSIPLVPTPSSGNWLSNLLKPGGGSSGGSGGGSTPKPPTSQQPTTPKPSPTVASTLSKSSIIPGLPDWVTLLGGGLLVMKVVGR